MENEQRTSSSQPAKRECDVPARYIFAGLISAGLAIIYGLKVTMSVAIVVMINNTALMVKQEHVNHTGNSSHHHSKSLACSASASMDLNGTEEHNDDIQDGPFSWSEPTQGLVLGAYFWGYILTQIPGGRLAEMYSGKWVIWGSVFINVVLTLLTPIAAKWSYVAVLVVRFIEGLGGGVSLPATHVMLSRWALPEERNAISSFALAGMPMGTVISLPLSGFLADFLGWEWVFYVQGGLSMIWCILWIFLVYDSPEDHPRISQHESELFNQGLKNGAREGHKVLPVPWKALLASVPFWAIVVAHICSNFGWYMLLVELPTYMKQILRFKISKNSLLSAIPYLSLWIFSIIWSNRMDWAKRKGWLNTTTIRILSTSMASLLPAACFIGVSFAGCNRTIAVSLMTLGATFIAGKYCGFLANHIDIAPNYAGTLMGLTNTAATIPGFVVPFFVGELTHGNQSLGQWQIIFFTTAAIMLVECLVYAICASGEEQPWNRAYVDVKQSVTQEKNEEKCMTETVNMLK